LPAVDTLIIDSGSSDQTPIIVKESNYRLVSIKKEDFNHGSTRQMGVALCNAQFIIFLTQDAILTQSKSLQNIIQCFENPRVGAAYGRQLPHADSGVLGTHARLFNYPEQSKIKSLADARNIGIKAAFLSNSFAAYRREALIAVGGFPNNTILGEDTYVAAKMLLADWKIAYCAEAQVYHSHDYTYLQEFNRYFDIGVFHSRESWIREKFGQAEGEGLKFVLSEAKYLIDSGKWYLLPSAFIRTCLKYLGYRLGMREKSLPVKIKKYLSMHKRFWDQ
jgi:rhamnosyltransferase